MAPIISSCNASPLPYTIHYTSHSAGCYLIASERDYTNSHWMSLSTAIPKSFVYISRQYNSEYQKSKTKKQANKHTKDKIKQKIEGPCKIPEASACCCQIKWTLISLSRGFFFPSVLFYYATTQSSLHA